MSQDSPPISVERARAPRNVVAGLAALGAVGVLVVGLAAAYRPAAHPPSTSSAAPATSAPVAVAPTPTNPDDISHAGSPTPRPSSTFVPPTATPFPTLPPYQPSENEFSLDIRVEKAQWRGQPVDFELSLVYEGLAREVTIWGLATNLATVEMSDSDGAFRARWTAPGDIRCQGHVLKRDEPMTIPLDGGGPDGPLAAGVWTIYASADFVAASGDTECIDDRPRAVSQELNVITDDYLWVTQSPPPQPPEAGCPEELSARYGPPPSLSVGVSNLGVTMVDGVFFRDDSGGYEIDYGAHLVDLPQNPFRRAPGETVSIRPPTGFQILSGGAYRYAADSFVVLENAVEETGDVLGHPKVSLDDDGNLVVTAPDALGDWVVQVRVVWLNACAGGGGEVNFGLEVR